MPSLLGSSGLPVAGPSLVLAGLTRGLTMGGMAPAGTRWDRSLAADLWGGSFNQTSHMSLKQESTMAQTRPYRNHSRVEEMDLIFITYCGP